MVQYIPKAPVVAEIENRIKEIKSVMQSKYDKFWAGQITAFKGVLKILDTLEVKKNNLVEEIDYDDYVRFFKEHPDYNDGSWGFEETWTFAQYCYKLGLNAQKGE